MSTLTLAKLLDNYDKTGKPEYMIASEVATTLDAKSVYTKFVFSKAKPQYKLGYNML